MDEQSETEIHIRKNEDEELRELLTDISLAEQMLEAAHQRYEVRQKEISQRRQLASGQKEISQRRRLASGRRTLKRDNDTVEDVTPIPKIRRTCDDEDDRICGGPVVRRVIEGLESTNIPAVNNYPDEPEDPNSEEPDPNSDSEEHSKTLLNREIADLLSELADLENGENLENQDSLTRDETTERQYHFSGTAIKFQNENGMRCRASHGPQCPYC